MFVAWSTETSEPAWAAELDPENRSQFRYWCCPDRHHQVFYRKAHEKQTRHVRAHFFRKSEPINCPHGESDEHRNMKYAVVDALARGVPLVDAASLVPMGALRGSIGDNIRVELPWETPTEARRGDVVLTFPMRHPLWGKGVDFEVQLYPLTDEDKAIRTADWCREGYSVAWLKKDDFSKDAGGMVAVQEPIPVSDPWFVFPLAARFKEASKTLQAASEELERVRNRIIQTPMDKIASILENTLLCPKCKGGMVPRKGKDNSYFFGCSGYPDCRGTRDARAIVDMARAFSNFARELRA